MEPFPQESSPPALQDQHLIYKELTLASHEQFVAQKHKTATKNFWR
jgi:hypothetical protein